MCGIRRGARGAGRARRIDGARLVLICNRQRRVGLSWRQKAKPPLHDAVGLGEEAVTTDVDSVAVVIDRTRQAAHIAAHFKHNRFHVCTGEQLVRRGQPRRTGADDDRGLLGHGINFSPAKVLARHVRTVLAIIPASPQDPKQEQTQCAPPVADRKIRFTSYLAQ